MIWKQESTPLLACLLACLWCFSGISVQTHAELFISQARIHRNQNQFEKLQINFLKKAQV